VGGGAKRAGPEAELDRRGEGDLELSGGALGGETLRDQGGKFGKAGFSLFSFEGEVHKERVRYVGPIQRADNLRDTLPGSPKARGHLLQRETRILEHDRAQTGAELFH
jgi:hypothetical protein